MINDKQFTLKKYLTNEYALLNNGIEVAYVDHQSAFTIVDLLNDLYEENQRLKRQNKCLQKENEDLNEKLIELDTFK